MLMFLFVLFCCKDEPRLFEVNSKNKLIFIILFTFKIIDLFFERCTLAQSNLMLVYNYNTFW